MVVDRTTEPAFYVKGNVIFQRPVRTERGLTVGFRVCTVADGVDPSEVCAILNKGQLVADGS